MHLEVAKDVSGVRQSILPLTQPFQSDYLDADKHAASSNSRSLLQSKEFSDLPKMLGVQIVDKGETALLLTQKDSSWSQFAQVPPQRRLGKGAGSGAPLDGQYATGPR